ncbi:MAG: hypothetical protein F2889_03960 [Actinobacteria bacterium]|uniref:Unannotated protein n=1 Tax=freshwater metagenome TaxID=449393 RepID=A0A6J7PH19_9ZZZZ|nr:hypothetical protein [Actinomycetota bacterium]
MPNIDIATPASSVPTDRLTLGVGWVRPGAGSVGGTVNPSGHDACYPGLTMICVCFAGNEE